MSVTTAWIILILAGLVEIAWAVGLRYTENWTRLWPSVFVIVAYILDIVLLSFPIRVLPIGTAYMVWVGIGSLGVAVFGIVHLGESVSVIRLACLFLILVGVVGLKVIDA